jgi:3-oxoacyl-[acyl-carrier-protein] synthase-3
MKHAQIVSTGSYLPGEPISNEKIESLVGPLPEDVLEGIQVKQRHWMVDPDTGEHLENNSDMAFKAAQEALDLAGIDRQAVDLIVTSTASPEYPLPSMAVFLQEKLGIPSCAAIEIRSGCAGAVEALDLARLYLERGMYNTAVVVGSEAISPLLVPIYLGKDPNAVRMRDRLAPYNFGDGAGAMVLQASDDGEGILGSAIVSVGGERKPAMQIVGAGTHAPIHKQLKAPRLVDLRVDVVESGRFTPYVMTEGLSETLKRSGVSAESIDLCVIPEGNAGYITVELEEAGLLTPEWTAIEAKIFENLTIVGATGSAAVPVALDYAWKTGRVKQGDRVMVLAIETSKWIYAGMVFPWAAPPCPQPIESKVGAAATS